MSKYHVSIPSWEAERKHIVFNITTIPPQGDTFSTKRRYRDFERLNKKLLERSFPQVALPGKLFLHNDTAIEARRVKLEKMFQSYVESYGVNSFVEEFLAPRESISLHNSRQSIMQESCIDETENNSVKLAEASFNGLVSAESSEDETSEEPYDQYELSAIEILVARAAYRSEREQSLRLARIYTIATLITLAGAASLRSPRWPFVGAAIGTAISATFAALDAIRVSKKEDWRRRGFGLEDSALKCSNSSDIDSFAQFMRQRKLRVATKQNASTEPDNVPEQMNGHAVPTIIEVGKKVEEEEEVPKDLAREVILEKMDRLHASGSHADVVAVAESFDVKKDPNVAWRWARGVYYESMVDLAYPVDRLGQVIAVLKQHAGKQSSSLVHKWIAIVSNVYGERKGAIRDRVEAALSFEFHTKMALEIDPNDPVLHYMLGRFSFDVSHLSWLERRGAKAISGKEPPNATVEDALRHFQNALSIKASPAVYLEIGKCYTNLKDVAKAKEFYKKAADFVPPGGDQIGIEEEHAVQEAISILAAKQ